MTTKPKIIAENVLFPTHFLSATEEEGVYLGQPDPDDDNSGSLKPISIGTDFTSMALDATLASGPQNTIFNAVGFDIYGDDYFINCKMRALKQFVDSGDVGHNVVGEGALSVSDVKRFGDYGIYFDGASYISIADHANWDIQANFSISLWVKHTDHVGTEMYVAQFQTDAERWFFYHLHGNGVHFGIRTGGVGVVEFGGAEIVDSGRHHVLLAKKGNEYGIYIDGVQSGYVDDASMAVFAGPLYIGQRGDGNYFDGHMDDIIIYHGNLFNASPNVGLTDTITVPITEHELDGTGFTKLHLKGDVAERTITDFRQVDGKVTVSPAFSANLATDEAFQITRDKNDVDFKLELTDGGDVGDADFKWSYDGGITYFGRDDPWQATWLAVTELLAADVYRTAGRQSMTQAANGDFIIVYGSIANADARIMRSTDNGLNWSTPTAIVPVIGTTFPWGMTTLRSGRILLILEMDAVHYIFYSDDHGETWANLSGNLGANRHENLIELTSGSILAVYSDANVVSCKKSTDGGKNWAAAVQIASDANDQMRPCIVQAENGDIVCAYRTDEDVITDFEIKCKISTDGGVTWGSAIDVIDFDTNDCGNPTIIKDINGTLFVASDRTNSNTMILSRSLDNGATWDVAGELVMLTDAVDKPDSGFFELSDSGDLICVFRTNTNKLSIMRRGIWELYSSNACPCAIEFYKQNLICGAKIKWARYAGITGDKWNFGSEYYFAKENLLLDSPSQPWKSEQDNVEVSIIIDLEELKGHPFDSIGLFGCNIRTLKIQASPVNETKGWVLPPVDEEVSFDLDTTGVIDSVVNNYIEDVTLLANYKDHELRNHYIRMTSATANGETYKIVDNIGDRFEVLSSGTIKASATDTFTIFKSGISCFFIDPDTTIWADLGSLEISGSNNSVEEQDIAGNLYLSGSAATNNLRKLIVGGDATLSTNSHDNCITGLQCSGTITDHGTDNVIEEGGWYNYPYRYIRILIESQDTYEGYYQIGNIVPAKHTELSTNWRVGYNLDSNFGIEMIRTPHGGLSTIRKHNEIKRFNLSWHQVDDTNIELTKLIDYIGGKNICLVPDGDDPTDCHLVKFTGIIKRRHTLLDRFDTSLVMEEVI